MPCSAVHNAGAGQGVLLASEDTGVATFIVPVLKENGQIRICEDFKVMANLVTVPEKIPIP